MSLSNGFADITINAVDPERHLYLFWLPFIKVRYILHTEPLPVFNKYTSPTCNTRLGKSKSIITVSNSMRLAIYQNWLITPKMQKHILVIHNSITEPRLNGQMRKVPGNTQYVTTLGHVSMRKNPYFWLEVAKEVTGTRSDVEFLWLGNGELLGHFQDLTQSMPRISFLGLINDTQAYLEKTDIYYQPSIIEPQGIAVLEAMYNSLPCIVSNAGGLPESVENGVNGIVASSTDVADNVNAITTLLASDETRSTYGRKAYLRYLKLFSPAIFKLKMDVIYNN
ncbi:glycosyltransferase family 4 protein [Mucilaginibacter sp.]